MDRNAAIPRSKAHETKPKALSAHDLKLFGATWLSSDEGRHVAMSENVWTVGLFGTA